MTLHNADVPNADLTTLANQAQVYRTLLHQENVTLQNADVHGADLSHSPFTGMHLPIVLLHKVMLTCWTMQLKMQKTVRHQYDKYNSKKLHSSIYVFGNYYVSVSDVPWNVYDTSNT